jgi:hypothetical protein
MAPGRETQEGVYRTYVHDYGTIEMDQQQQRPQHVEVSVNEGPRNRPRPRRWKLVLSAVLLAVLLGTAACIGELWSNYLSLLKSDLALPTKAVTAAVIIGCGDMAAQILEKRNLQHDGVVSPKPDLARVCRWVSFGLFISAPWNHFFYEVLTFECLITCLIAL